MAYLTDNSQFNPAAPLVMHIDLNSCFATIEQQANPRLRGNPIAVAAYKSPGGCILAPSIEAKLCGIKVGMSVKEGKKLCPTLTVLEPDPWKYRNVHLSLRQLLLTYTDDITPKSIDEFVLNFAGTELTENLLFVGRQIKQRIQAEIGDWLRVSIGISTNRFLAKTASNLKKPDGLDVIDKANYLQIFSSLDLTDLTGIKANNAKRLNIHGIDTVLAFYYASPMQLQQAFHSVTGHYWHMRLHGWEVDNLPAKRGSFSNSVAVGTVIKTIAQLVPILTKLVEKMAARMRAAGFRARGVHLALSYKNHTYWHKGVTLDHYLYSSGDIYKVAFTLLKQTYLDRAVHIIAITCFDLEYIKNTQLHLIDRVDKKMLLTKALDDINNKWGSFVIKPATMTNTRDLIKDRISFGGVKELEELILPY